MTGAASFFVGRRFLEFVLTVRQQFPDVDQFRVQWAFDDNNRDEEQTRSFLESEFYQEEFSIKV